MIVDKNKKYRTLNGCPARIYCTDAGGNFPVHGALLRNPHATEAQWFLESWQISGQRDNMPSSWDLVEITDESA